MAKKISFFIYLYSTIVAWIAVIFWFSSLENLQYNYTEYSLSLERATYFFAFIILNILIFRTLIATFRSIIDKLSFARSKRERKEDKEFTVITETLLLLISILASIIIVLINQYILIEIQGREGDIPLLIINLSAVLLGALITYNWPILKELESKIAKLDI